MKPLIKWHWAQNKALTLNLPPTREAIALVHNFGGSQENFSKHIQLLNGLGFDVAAFDLSWHPLGHKKFILKPLRKHWAEEIFLVFQEITRVRPIIPFAFSGLGVCVIDAVARLLQQSPEMIASLIFDSGPFIENQQCIENMLEFHFQLPSKAIRKSLAWSLDKAWDPHNTESTRSSLEKILKIKPRLSLLSLQGLEDKIVPQAYIEACFAPVKRASENYAQVIFEKGGHLTSLKMEPEKYHMVVGKFLRP